MQNIVSLTVNNQIYAGWKSVRIEAGVERVARSFELSVTMRWPGNVDFDNRIKPGAAAEIRIDEDLVCTGYVDATPINYDADQVSIIIRGRSKTADLVDCSADAGAGQFRGLQLESIAAKLAGQYGVSVVTQVATGAPLTDHQTQQGESVFESLDRLAKLRQVLITDDESGNLVIASTGSAGDATSGLALGVNILTGSAGFDYAEVYTSYQVKGQKAGTDDSFGAASSQLLGTAADSTLTRQRVLIVRQSGQADAGSCLKRAQYEAQIRAAKAQEIRYRVADWRQADGSLWRPNTMVQVDDAIMGVSAVMLISEVIYSLDESGMVTDLTVIPPSAFQTYTEKQAKYTVKKGKNGKKVAAGWP